MKDKLKVLIKLFISFFKISLFTYGGGYAMIPFLKLEISQKHKWIEEEEILDMFTIANIFPGVNFTNAAAVVGFRVAGASGACVAVLASLIPTFAAAMVLTIFVNQLMGNVIVKKLVDGIIIGVTSIMIMTVISFAKKSVKGYVGMIALIISFILFEIIKVKVYVLIIMATLLGILNAYIKQKKEVRNNA